ncbi:hypothetical protein KORDIASMS9_04303 [Kordia sp. SMS9]|uniref:hypothetical protein n=1 Tax=Kordia sp. SMS9 TaxID=2282170 RepID=UPI000E10827F|nr:hypothetical protein [Kordia sp. SMS9]AXG72041.1 hypothetical protein KORDIASMS9_04303 [Kordia sp. SMS9]
MKKRTIKSLELNKKTISKMESSKVQGGYTTWTAYTYTIIVLGEAIANYTEQD